jgi:hypothetical protein
MKFSLSTILLSIALLAVCLGWYLDKMQYAKLAESLLSAERVDIRRGSGFVSTPIRPYSDSEMKLLEVTGTTFRNVGQVLEILATFNCRNDKPKDDVVFAHAFTLMLVLNCENLSDLQNKIETLEYDPRIITDSNHPLHKEFKRFLEESMTRYEG